MESTPSRTHSFRSSLMSFFKSSMSTVVAGVTSITRTSFFSYGAKHRPMASNSLRLGPLSWLSGSLSGRNGWVSGDLSVARFSSKSRHRIPGALEANSLGFRTFRHHPQTRRNVTLCLIFLTRLGTKSSLDDPPQLKATPRRNMRTAQTFVEKIGIILWLAESIFPSASSRFHFTYPSQPPVGKK